MPLRENIFCDYLFNDVANQLSMPRASPPLIDSADRSLDIRRIAGCDLWHNDNGLDFNDLRISPVGDGLDR